MRCSACEGSRRSREEDCQRCYWDQANALTDPFYLSSVKPFSFICSTFLVASYVIGLWFSLRTHAAQIWEMPIHGPESGSIPPAQSSPAVLANWRNNIPDEPFLKRIGERMSSRFLRGEHPSSTPTTNRHGSTESTGNGSARRNTQETIHPPILSQAMTQEDTNLFVRNVAEVAAAAATLAVHNSQTPTPQATPRIPPPQPLSTNIESTPKGPRGRVSHDWDADLAEAEMHGGGGHDAPNWSRTKSSMILLGATILYAIIAGILRGS